MPTLDFTFATESDYVKTSLLEFPGTQCQYSLKDLLGLLFTEDFANDTGFTYDSAKAEFSGGQVQQKSVKPANATFYAPYTSNENAAWSSGVGSGTLNGGATVTGGALVTTSGSSDACIYSATDNANFAFIITVRTRLLFNYTGVAGAIHTVFTVCEDSSLRNAVILRFDSGNNLNLLVYNSSGSLIGYMPFGVWTPSDMVTPVEFELDMDVTTGATRVFINGTQFGTTKANTVPARTTGANSLIVGNDNGKTSNFLGSILDFLVFDTIQHTANYTPDWSNIFDYVYFESVVELPQSSYSGLGTIQAFTNFVSTESNAPRWIINSLYWDGGAWSASSDTWATASPVADILANIATLPASDTLDISIVFNDGSSQMSVSNLVTTYTGQEYPEESDAQNVYPNTVIRTDKLNSIDFTSSTNAKYILVKNSTEYYYTGGAWVVSDGTYTQANTAAELTDLVVADFTSTGIDFYVKTVFGGNGTTLEYIDNMSIDFSFAGEDPTIITSTVYGFLTNLCGEGLESKPIKARVYKTQAEFDDGVIIDLAYQSVLTDVNGYWEICIAYDTVDSMPVYIEFNINGEKTIKKMLYQSTIKYTEMEGIV